jgi:flagellar motility protein MotE (MotC chaperone)
VTGGQSGLRRIGLVVLLALLLSSALGRVVSASLSTATDRQDEPEAQTEALLCPPSREIEDLLSQIASRDAALDAREGVLARREQDLRIARQEIRGAMTRLDEARAALESRMALSDTAAEEDVTRLVAVYEGMKPREAAALFEAMEAGFAAGFLARMRPERASEVFSNMAPDWAYAVSAIIAGRNADAARGTEE